MAIAPNLVIEDYCTWLKDNSRTEHVQGSIEITVPFLDSNNDHLQYYIDESQNGFTITDIGRTINELELAGCNFTETRIRQLNEFLHSFGVKRNHDDELFIIAQDVSELPQKQHLLIQAMLAIGDMFMVTSSRVSNLFLNDIETYFLKNNIFFSSGLSKIGKSGFPYNIDFVLPKANSKPSRYVVALNNPNTSAVKAKLFMLDDTDINRRNEKLYIILNDSSKNVSSLIAPIESCGALALPWSRRDEHRELFAS